MKKMFFLLLAIAGSMAPACAQTEVPLPYQNPYLPQATNRSDAIFNSPPSGSLQHQFTFGLGNGNTMRMEFSYVGQLRQLNDLDSLFHAVWNGLRPFADSLTKPLVSRRIDYRIGSAGDVRVRILEHAEQGEVYRIYKNDTSQVKVEQDTLRIIQYTRDSSRYSRSTIVNGRYVKNYMEQAYVITLVLNNIGDLPRLSTADLFWALTHLKEELGKNLNTPPNKQYFSRFSAAYDVPARRKISPARMTAFSSVYALAPYVQVGFQFARGTWLPSAGLGIELSKRVSETTTRFYRLIWEPHFAFGRDANGNTVMERNDFATFRYSVNTRRPGTRELMFAQNFSLGYLRHRRGSTFEDNTFKFTLPGLQTKNILLEPEFFFNKSFRNFSPSLKLTLVLE
jgi:hypothetical protein